MIVSYEIPAELVQEVNEAVRKVLEFRSKQTPNFVPFWENGHLFTSAAEYEDYTKRVKERDYNLQQVAINQAINNKILPPGAFDIRTATAEDALFEWYFTFELAPFGHVGPMEYVHKLHTWLDNMGNGEVRNPEFPNIDMTDKWWFVRGGWDWSQYHGPLRDKLSIQRGYKV